MSQVRVLGLIGAAAITIAAVAYAQTTVSALPDNGDVQAAPLNGVAEQVTWGDAKAGASKAGTCAACHGLDGNPSDPQYPRLAGQPERFVAQQLHLFKVDERNGPQAEIMKPFAKPLTDQDMRDLGAYFATQKPGAGVADDTLIAEGPNAGRKFYEVGQQLFVSGDAARGIPACMACHGPAGYGNPGPPYPAVAGQMAPYAQRRLEEYRASAGEPNRPNYNIMVSIARNLTDEEIGALASYVQGLHPRADDVVATTPGATPYFGEPAAPPALVPGDATPPADPSPVVTPTGP